MGDFGCDPQDEQLDLWEFLLLVYWEEHVGLAVEADLNPFGGSLAVQTWEAPRKTHSETALPSFETHSFPCREVPGLSTLFWEPPGWDLTVWQVL